MAAIKILPDIYSVGVVDWNVRNFHGHTTKSPEPFFFNFAQSNKDKKTNR